MRKMDTGGESEFKPGTQARTAMERSGLYGFLATIYRTEPTEAMLRKLRAPAFTEALGIDIPEAGESEAAEELATEFAALFLGPGGHISPHESVQLEDGGQLLGQTTTEVRNYIEACGFEYDPDYHGLPDHISVELEFMAEATSQEAMAWQELDYAKALNCLDFEQEFINLHLAKWVPDFCKKVTKRAQLAFYQQVANITHDFIVAERSEIDKRRHLVKPFLGEDRRPTKYRAEC